jgi:hypothetical protein
MKFVVLLAVLATLLSQAEGYLSPRIKGRMYMVQSVKMSDKKRVTNNSNRNAFNAPVNAYRNSIKTKGGDSVAISPKAAPVDPKVERLHLTSDRKDLTTLTIGQKMKGKLQILIFSRYLLLTHLLY